MRFSRIVTVFVLVVLLTTSIVSPAYAGANAKTVRIIIKNTTGSVITVYFYGNNNATVELKPGNNKVDLERGSYRYSYIACGQNFYGTIDVRKAKEQFEFACAAGTTGVQIKIQNKNTVPFYITFKGDKEYRFYLKPGLNTVELPKGNYRYSYSVCGKNRNKNFKVTKPTNLNLKDCKLIRVKMNNLTGGNMTLYLNGDTSYTFTVAPGKSNIQILQGTYKYYNYTICGGVSSGTMQFKKNIVWTWWCG